MKTNVKMKNSAKTGNFPFKSLKSLKFPLAFAIAICLLFSALLSTNHRNFAAVAEANAGNTNDTLKIVSVGFVSDNNGEFRISTDDFISDANFLKIISTFGKISFEFAAVMPFALKLKRPFSPSCTVIPE